jgi:hypothetical protein
LTCTRIVHTMGLWITNRILRKQCRTWPSMVLISARGATREDRRAYERKRV